jgi:hypothetical protein
MFTYCEEQYSDLHKDVYGFRPRGENYSRWVNMTPERKQEEWDYLVACLAIELANEKAAEQESIKLFEARVLELIAYGAKDRETAIRWISDAHECNGDDEHLEWHLGIPYGYLSGKIKYRIEA